MRYGRIVIVAVLMLFAAVALGQPSGAGVLSDLHTATASADAATPPPVVEPTPDATPATSTTDATAAPATVDAEGGDAATEPVEPEPTIGELIDQGKEAVDIWKTQGWIAGLAAIIYLLIQGTKIGFVKSLLGVRKWLRPLIALVLGAIGGVLAGIAGGIVWYSAIGGALIAALSSSGFNELMNTTTAAGRAKSTGVAEPKK